MSWKFSKKKTVVLRSFILEVMLSYILEKVVLEIFRKENCCVENF